MIRVKRNTQFWIPRDILEFFRKNSNIWEILNEGGQVDLTEEQFEQCKQYIIIIEIPKIIKKATPKPIIKLKEESQSEGIIKEV